MIEGNNKLTKENTKDNILLVNINRSFKKAVNSNGIVDPEILYWATKESWPVDLNQIKNIRYICPVYKGKILETFELTEGTCWYFAGVIVTERKTNKRYGFCGHPVAESIYNDMDVSDHLTNHQWLHRYLWKQK